MNTVMNTAGLLFGILVLAFVVSTTTAQSSPNPEAEIQPESKVAQGRMAHEWCLPTFVPAGPDPFLERGLAVICRDAGKLLDGGYLALVPHLDGAPEDDIDFTAELDRAEIVVMVGGFDRNTDGPEVLNPRLGPWLVRHAESLTSDVPWWEWVVDCPLPPADAGHVEPKPLLNARRAQAATDLYEQSLEDLQILSMFHQDMQDDPSSLREAIDAYPWKTERMLSPQTGYSPIGICLWFQNQDALQARHRLADRISVADSIVRDMSALSTRLGTLRIAARIAERVPLGSPGFRSLTLDPLWPVYAWELIAASERQRQLAERNRRFLRRTAEAIGKRHGFGPKVVARFQERFEQILLKLPPGVDLDREIGKEAEDYLTAFSAPTESEVLPVRMPFPPTDLVAADEVAQNAAWRLHARAWNTSGGLLPSEVERRDSQHSGILEQVEQGMTGRNVGTLGHALTQLRNPWQPWGAFPYPEPLPDARGSRTVAAQVAAAVDDILNGDDQRAHDVAPFYFQDIFRRLVCDHGQSPLRSGGRGMVFPSGNACFADLVDEIRPDGSVGYRYECNMVINGGPYAWAPTGPE